MKTESIHNRKQLVGSESTILEVFSRILLILAIVGALVFIGVRVTGEGGFRDVSQSPQQSERQMESATQTMPAQ